MKTHFYIWLDTELQRVASVRKSVVSHFSSISNVGPVKCDDEFSNVPLTLLYNTDDQHQSNQLVDVTASLYKPEVPERQRVGFV